MRLAYLSGPVDAADVYARWKIGKHTKLFGTSYLMQFYELCSELDADALVITTLPGPFQRLHDQNISIENRPLPQSNGLRYHLAMLKWMLALAPTLKRFKPSALVITANQNYWFALFYARFLRIEIIPSAHCVMWRPFAPAPRHWRFLLWLDGLFLRYCVRRAMAISDVVAQQLKVLAGFGRITVETVLPTYASGHFDGIPPPDFATRPFRILFNGRMETNKGIYDLVHIASRLDEERPGEFFFDICGDGTELERLRTSVERSGLDHIMRVHGFCDKDKLTGLLAESHAVIVPTRSDFEEGLAKSCVEAVLAGRPFITSAVCPALNSLSAAGIEAAPDDATSYGDAILSLAYDGTLYRLKREACVGLQAQFYEPGNGYGAVLRRQLELSGISRAPG